MSISSVMWCRVVLWWDTKVTEIHAASMFRVKHWYPTTTLHGVTTQKTTHGRLETSNLA